MSEPRHVFVQTEGGFNVRAMAFDRREKYGFELRRSRYTLTDGDEYRALIERARDVLALPVHKEALGKGELLRDLLAYLGETP